MHDLSDAESLVEQMDTPAAVAVHIEAALRDGDQAAKPCAGGHEVNRCAWVPDKEICNNKTCISVSQLYSPAFIPQLLPNL